MSPDGSAPRLCRFSSRRKSFTGASGAAATWCATGMGVGGFSSPFRGQERWLRLKTNARGVPVSARCCRYQRANNCDRRRSGTLRLSRSLPRDRMFESGFLPWGVKRIRRWSENYAAMHAITSPVRCFWRINHKRDFSCVRPGHDSICPVGGLWNEPGFF